MGLDNDVGTIVSRSYRVHPGEGFQDKARPRYHCKAVPKTAGAHGSCVQRNTFWPSVHETPTVVVENQGVFLERESVPYDQDHAPMPSCPVHMEETLVSVPRPSVGSVMSLKSHFHVPLDVGPAGEAPAGRAFPPWCMEDEACDLFQSPNLGSGCGP